MTMNENTIEFNYKAKSTSKGFFVIGLVLLLISVVLLIVSFTSESKDAQWNRFIPAAVLLIVALYFLFRALVMNIKEKRNLKICISPQGVTTPKGRLIPIEDINHCVLEYRVGTYTGVCSKVYLIIQLKSGKKETFDFSYYAVPFSYDFKKNDFHEKTNTILGIPLFDRGILTMYDDSPSNGAETKNG